MRDFIFFCDFTFIIRNVLGDFASKTAILRFNFFDLNDRLEQISIIDDPPKVLNEMVDWSKFDGILFMAKAKDLTDCKVSGNAGRKPFAP